MQGRSKSLTSIDALPVGGGGHAAAGGGGDAMDPDGGAAAASSSDRLNVPLRCDSAGAAAAGAGNGRLMHFQRRRKLWMKQSRQVDLILSRLLVLYSSFC